MSAYMVNRTHLAALVRVGLQGPSGRTVSPDTVWHELTWYDLPLSDLQSLPWQESGARLQRLDFTTAERVADMLWAENAASIRYRYDDADSSGMVPAYEPWMTREITSAPRLSAVEALKALDCFTYQSCEHPEWHASEAHAFCERLRLALIGHLPGYRDAAWEISEDSPARGR